MLFKCSCGADKHHGTGGKEDAVFEGFCPIGKLGYVECEQQNQREFHDLGGLELNWSESYPARRALGGNADSGNKDAPEKQIADAENRKSHFFEKSVVNNGHPDHRDDTDDAPDDLFFDKIKAVMSEGGTVFCIDVAGRGDHDRTEAEKQDDENQKRLVNAAANAVDRRFVGANKLVKKFFDRIFDRSGRGGGCIRRSARAAQTAGVGFIGCLCHWCIPFFLY